MQAEILSSGGKVKQQTLGWNEAKGKTVVQRSKEDANDYRYFPEPDLPPLVVDHAWLSTVTASMPEMPDSKRARYAKDMGLNREDIERLVERKNTSNSSKPPGSRAQTQPKTVVNWIADRPVRLVEPE
jgi:aspartyl-tRNA(Asn)/glutamyl-tRNA(Gln) amidotransferase subunit B